MDGWKCNYRRGKEDKGFIRECSFFFLFPEFRSSWSKLYRWHQACNLCVIRTDLFDLKPTAGELLRALHVPRCHPSQVGPLRGLEQQQPDPLPGMLGALGAAAAPPRWHPPPQLSLVSSWFALIFLTSSSWISPPLSCHMICFFRQLIHLLVSVSFQVWLRFFLWPGQEFFPSLKVSALWTSKFLSPFYSV